MKTPVNFTQAHDAENIEMMGIRMSVILSTECSGGKLTIIEQEVSCGAGSPPHICNREDKVIYISEGTFMLLADGQMYIAEKGANIFVPRGTTHNFKNIGTQTGRLLVTLTPGGHEHFLKDLSRTVKVYGKDPHAMKEVADRYDVVLV